MIARIRHHADTQPHRVLGLILAAGLLIHLVLAFGTTGNRFDLGSFTLVRDLLLGDALHVYEGVDSPIPRWPYPPGFFPFVLGTHGLSKVTGLAYPDLIRALFSVGDVILALLVFHGLRSRISDRRALMGAALVALGPSLVFVSGNQGQLDGFAFIPAVMALLIWDDPRHMRRRAVYAGLLLGIAGSIKTVPGILVLALLPTARDVREALTVCVTAAGTLAVILLPFVVASPQAVADVLRYDGLPGLGGLSLFAQPEIPKTMLSGLRGLERTDLTEFLQDVNGYMTVIALLAVTAVLVRRKVPARSAAAVLVLTVLTFGVNFAFGYSVWAVLMLVLDNRLRAALALQLVLLVPMVIVGFVHRQEGGWDPAVIDWVFVPFMMVAFVVTAAIWWHLLEATRDATAPDPVAP